MKHNNRFCSAILGLTLLGSLLGTVGCTSYAPPPPPPPPAQAPPIVQLAEHNGFETGRADGEHEVANGFAAAPTHTRAYRECPGYDPHLGPFKVYVQTFRRAYLRGYDKGYFHR